MGPVFYPPGADDLPAMIALNNAVAVETSFLEPAAMGALLDMAFWVRCTQDSTAFCIALDQDAAYASPNFTWFHQRYPRFVYVDRIVVAAQARGHGLARALYGELMAAAVHAHHTMLCCEVNVDPPNVASDRFHHASGFVEVGRAFLADRGKAVKYLARQL